MHVLSKATALAIHLCLPDAHKAAAPYTDIAPYVERCRTGLELINEEMISAMMFVQPIVREWAPNWKFSYLVAVSLGVKFITGGFYISDIVTYVTDQFDLDTLRFGEAIAFDSYHWGDMKTRFVRFRNALINVALQHANLPDPFIDVRVDNEQSDLHVLIVDSSLDEAARQRTLIKLLSPRCLVQCCHRHVLSQTLPAPSALVSISHMRLSALPPNCVMRSQTHAIKYLKSCLEKGDAINLVIADFERTLKQDDLNVCPSNETFVDVIARANGFNLSEQIDKVCADTDALSIHFGYKPLVAVVAHFYHDIASHMSFDVDGSCRGCDVVQQKPLNEACMRVLLQACCL